MASTSSEGQLTMVISLAGGAVLKLVALTFIGRNHRKLFQKIGTVSNLYIYPVKSCGVTEVTVADCTPVGLQSEGLSDRHWMVVDPNQKILTMKEEPRLTIIKCSSIGDSIVLTATGMEPLRLPKNPDLKTSPRMMKIFSQQPIPIVNCGPEAEAWISTFLQRPAMIVYSCSDLGTRDVFDRKRKWPNTSKKGDTTIFSYLTSYMIASTESLKEVNCQITHPVSMVNFRPNIVVQNNVPFDEDNWKEVLIGEKVLFHSVEPCRRCIMTTIDPDTAIAREDRQPLDLLKNFRCRKPYGTAPIFGLYVSLDTPGQIRVGDPVFVLKENYVVYQSQSVSYF